MLLKKSQETKQMREFMLGLRVGLDNIEGSSFFFFFFNKVLLNSDSLRENIIQNGKENTNLKNNVSLKNSCE